eukprot:TRINITY_DN20404_c4_g1_i1.p1 TRINITY_DN20404_c4_g1~~TRINITY_DN20404_c4_g1_i1.p1  ORF type:complete len:781 (-),score=240.71 TRINITY_DN20404_c4_g1_i1:236-2578(-)
MSHIDVPLKIVALFSQFDANGDGVLEKDELGTILSSLNGDLFTDDAVDKMLEAADINADGKVDLEEFVTWLFSGGDISDSVRGQYDITFKEFNSVKQGFDIYSDDHGYVWLDDDNAMKSLAAFLDMDPSVIRTQMQEADIDSNGCVGFAEFALWADKCSRGIKLGIDVPDKDHWKDGMPSYWKKDWPDEVEPFKPVPHDTDLSELENYIKLCKQNDWDPVWEILDRHPGYVDMRPRKRFFAAIHQAALKGDVEKLRTLVEKYGANPMLPAKNGRKPDYVAEAEGHDEAVAYIKEVSAKLFPDGTFVTKHELRGAADRALAAAKKGYDSAVFNELQAYPGIVNLGSRAKGFCLMHTYAFSGNVGMLKSLIEEYQADPIQKTKQGKTAEDVARSRDQDEAAEYLSQYTAEDSEAMQAAHNAITAAKEADWDALFELLEANKEIINMRPSNRVYPVLHLVAGHGNVSMLTKLVSKYGADVQLLSQDGKTAEQVASEQGKEGAVTYLQACCPTISLEDDFVKFPAPQLVPVEDDETIEALKSLLDKTHKTSRNWTRDRQGASGTHDPKTPVPSGYEFVGAVRNEHAALWRVYEISREVVKLQCQAPKRTDLSWETWVPWTMEDVDWSHVGLCTEANEWMLLHASVPPALEAISKKGFTMKTMGKGATTGGGGLYGDGSYFADSITKADEYARGAVEEDGDFQGCRTVSVVRVLGGRHFYTDEDVSQEEKPLFRQRVLEGAYHSTVGDRLKLKNTYREYVTYDASGTYLEYIIYYRRLGVPDEHK